MSVLNNLFTYLIMNFRLAPTCFMFFLLNVFIIHAKLNSVSLSGFYLALNHRYKLDK